MLSGRRPPSDIMDLALRPRGELEVTSERRRSPVERWRKEGKVFKIFLP